MKRRILQLACAGLVILAMSCGPRGTPYQDFQVTSALSTNTAHVGDLVHLRVAADHPADVQVALDPPSALTNLVVRDVASATRKMGDKKQRTTWDIALTTFVLGGHDLALGPVKFTGPDGTTREVPVPATFLAVESVLAGGNVEERPIKDVMSWPAPRSKLLAAALAAGALAALALALLTRWLKRRAEAPAPARPPIPPHELALAALQILLSRRWIEEEKVEPFYVELSQIVRAYIEARFNLRAPESTTEEFIREASASHHLSLDHQQLVGSFLEQCDLVKFAKHKPAQTDMRAAYAAAERLIRETIPVPQPSPASSIQHPESVPA